MGVKPSYSKAKLAKRPSLPPVARGVRVPPYVNRTQRDLLDAMRRERQRARQP